MERLSFTPHSRIGHARSRRMSSSDLHDDALRAILAAVETLLPSPDRWETPGSYDSVGLALIDAVWSIGVRYQSVENVIARYRAERLAGGDDPEPTAPRTCGASSRRAAAPRPSRSASATASGPRRPTASSRPRRCCARRASSRTKAWSVPADLTGASQERLDHLQGRWSTVPGQGSGVSWRAFSMLVGLPEVKPDRMIRRFVGRRPRTTAERPRWRRRGPRPRDGRRGAPRRVAPRARPRHLGLPKPSESGQG